jgi:glycosyltransferase involved in cell wall biosynthesis
MISIIIPFYNRKELLQEALESVLHQTSSDWECILVDDGSIDGSDEVVKEYVSIDNRFKYFKRNHKLKGASVCRNIGFQNAKGNWIMFLDSDDLLSPNCIENRLRDAYNYIDYDFLIYNSIAFDEQGKKVYWNIETDEPDLTRFLRLDGLWNISSTLYRKTYIDNIPMPLFTETLPFLQDWELAVRLIFSKANYKKFLDNEPDVFIRRHNSGSISQKGWNNKFMIYRKFCVIKSCFKFVPKDETKLRENICIPLINIVKEVIVQKKYNQAYMLICHIRKEFMVRRIDVLYLFLGYRFYLARNKNLFLNVTYKFLNFIFIRFVNKSLIFPHYDILQHSYK